MYTIGLSSCGKIINEKLFADYARAGIGVMEISPRANEYDALNYGEIEALSQKYGIGLWSYHLPFAPCEELDISSSALAQATVVYLSELIRKGASIGIDKFVIHPSGEPIADGERGERLLCAQNSLAELAEIAGRHGAILAVEDLPRTCLGRNAEEVEALVNAHEALSVCFDTNHLLSGDPVEFIHRLGDKIVTLHVSDYDFMNERHWLPGEGKVDWPAIFTALREVNYRGPWLYEISPECPNTIFRDRNLVCEDFVANAKALFAGEKPPIFSTPKPNLGMWG